MATLIRTGFTGTIVWLGLVADRAAGLSSQPCTEMTLGLDGPAGEAHGGLTRPACSCVAGLYPRGTVIRNVRQLSLIAAEDLAAIAQRMGLATLDPGLVGANLVIAGIPDFSRLPPSSRLQAAGGATLVVDLENRPCNLPGKPISQAHPGFGPAFRTAAAGRRGVTAWVEREGRMAIGEAVTLHVPDQPAWAHLDEARR